MLRIPWAWLCKKHSNFALQRFALGFFAPAGPSAARAARAALDLTGAESVAVNRSTVAPQIRRDRQVVFQRLWPLALARTVLADLEHIGQHLRHRPSTESSP